MSGYFDKLGARASVAMAAAPVAPVEHLRLNLPAETEAAPKPAPRAEPPSQDVQPTEPQFAETTPDAPEAETVSTELPTAPDAVSEGAKQTLPEPASDIVRSAEIEVPEPDAPSVEVSAPLPEIFENTTETEARIAQSVSPESIDATPIAEDTAPAEPAPPAPEEMSPEDHVALFEAYIDKLNNRSEAPPEQVTPPAPPPAQDVEPPESVAPDLSAPPAQPAPARPKLEIGEVIVEVAAAKPATSGASAAALAPRRVRSPSRARRLGRAVGLGPL